MSADDEPRQLTDEIKRPGETDWHDDDGGPWPVGTLVRKKAVRRPGQRTRIRRLILRVSGLSEPDDAGDRYLTYETVGSETIEFEAVP